MNSLVYSLIVALSFNISCYGKSFNDTLFAKQWGFENTGQSILRRSGELTREEVLGVANIDINHIDIRKLYPNIPEGREVVVAVLDSGLDINHPDLKGKVYFDKELCPSEEDAQNKPCSGINILKRSLDLTDDLGHGTHVAGIIAAIANNNLGVAGIADNRVKILPVKILSEETNGFVYNNRIITDLFADGIAYAIQRGADVINMSIGWPKLVETPRMKKALGLAIQNNVVIVAAAGNNNKQIPTYPCTSEKVICVGAIDNRGEITEFSNFGGKVDILAPGEFIISTYPRDSVESRILRIRGYESKKGTSQASPYIAAIAASLKLINPEMSLNEVQARLFSSAHSEKGVKNEKFTKYGLANMAQALREKPKSFATPDFKGLLDLNFKKDDGTFFFSLPIESLIGEFNDLAVNISFERDDIKLEEENYKIKLREGQRKSLLIKGQLTNLNKDTHFKMTVGLSAGEFKSETQTTLIFARDLAREGVDNEAIIAGFKGSDLTFFKNDRKVSRVKKVRFSTENTGSPIYFTEVSPSQNEAEKTILSLVIKRKGEWGREDIKLDKLHEVTSVTSEDFNGDGLFDYLISGVSADQKNLIFNYHLAQLAKEGEGSSYTELSYEFPLLEYRNFPLDYTELSKTSFLALPQGENQLLVPTFFTSYRLPHEDNTDDILDRVPEEAVAPHQYYLEPFIKEGRKKMRLRVVNSLAAMNIFRLQFFIEEWQRVSLDESFPQSPKERRNGVIRGLVSVGEEFARDYYLYTANKGSLSFERVFFPDRLLAGNNTRQLLGVERENFGEVTQTVEFLAQLKRDQVRSYVWNPVTKRGEALIIDTLNWSDPIFNSISAFDDKERTRLIETRYYLRSYGKEGELGRLRINRESSFPGVQFSETLSPILLKDGDNTLPGLFVNSTLIFGNRLYSMVQTKDGLIRPLKYSVDIPNLCVHLKPEKMDGVFHYVMLCRKGQGKVALESIPLN